MSEAISSNLASFISSRCVIFNLSGLKEGTRMEYGCILGKLIKTVPRREMMSFSGSPHLLNGVCLISYGVLMLLVLGCSAPNSYYFLGTVPSGYSLPYLKFPTVEWARNFSKNTIFFPKEVLYLSVS